MLDGEAGRPQRRQQPGPAGGVAGLLLRDVVVVSERGDRRGLHRRRAEQPDVLARLGEGGHRRPVAEREPGAVPGEVAALGQRVQRQQALGRAAGDRRVQHAHRLGVPTQLEVALVAGHQHPVLAGPRDDCAQPLRCQHLAGGVGGRVEPDQRDPRRVVRGRVVDRDRDAAGEAGARVVGRVGQTREEHLGARLEPEQGGQQRHELLAADAREHLALGELGAEPPGGPADQGAAQRRRPDGERVARRVGRRAQRVLHQAGGRVDRRADRQVDHPARVGTGLVAVRREPVPREPGQGGPGRPAGAGPHAGAQVSAPRCSCRPARPARPGGRRRPARPCWRHRGCRWRSSR